MAHQHQHQDTPSRAKLAEGINKDHHRWTIPSSRPSYRFSTTYPAIEEASSAASSRSRTSRFTELVDDVSPPSTSHASAKSFQVFNHHQHSQQPQRRVLRRRGKVPQLREPISSCWVATPGGTPRPLSVLDQPGEAGMTQPKEEEEPKRASRISGIFSRKVNRASFLERSLTVLRRGTKRDRGDREQAAAETWADGAAGQVGTDNAGSRTDFLFSPVSWADPVQRRASYQTRAAAPEMTPAKKQPESEGFGDEVRVEPPSMSRFSISTDGGDIDHVRGLMRRILSKPFRSMRARRERRRDAEPGQEREVDDRRRPPPIQIIRRPLQVVREEQRSHGNDPISAGERLSWVEGDDGAAWAATEQISIDRRGWGATNTENSEGKDESGHRQHNVIQGSSLRRRGIGEVYQLGLSRPAKGGEDPGHEAAFSETDYRSLVAPGESRQGRVDLIRCSTRFEQVVCDSSNARLVEHMSI